MQPPTEMPSQSAMPEVVDQVALARLYGEPLFAMPQDLYIPPDALEVFLEAFEGPLDLLLYLIRKQNFNILDIPMAGLTRQYLSYVDEIRSRNLELAAEYLLMAAMLIEIKSRMLLPPKKTAEGVEPEDPRAELARRLPPFVMPVGLFVNASDAELAEGAKALPNMLLQFHGDETPADCERAGRPYLRAARITPGFDLLDFSLQFSGAQALLLDAHVDGYGGGGKVFDWSLIPKSVNSRLVLSGGLNVGNVATGLRQVRPWAVDVSSGVEVSKGIKDAALIQQFCDAVRAADQQT